MEWTDGRLDDLAKRVDDGFDEVKGDIGRLDAKIDDRFDRLDAKIERLTHVLLQAGVGMAASIIIGLAAVGAGVLFGG